MTKGRGYVCRQCGSESPKWLGKCPQCGEWNSYQERVENSKRFSPALDNRPVPQPLSQVSLEDFHRFAVPIRELDRVLGGGIVPGTLVLVGGDPGIGKSTLLLQLAGLMAERVGRVLYVSAEESVQQIKLRADRLDASSDGVYLLSETNLDIVLQHIQELQPALTIIDSIQTVYTEEVGAAPGSVGQVRECTLKLMGVAKSTNIAVFIVGHVTKEGVIAGPRLLEHMVDVVLYLEGERFQTFRVLRGVKNRFGSTNEIGVFEMTGHGLVEVDNPSQVFLSQHSSSVVGSAVVATLEGTRPFLVEIQALTTNTIFGLPRRTANGIDYNRLLLLTAVLSRRAGLALSSQDVFVNVVGGLQVHEPAVDLGIAVAIASSLGTIHVDPLTVFIGEIGLSGEIRPVPQLDRRLMEAGRLGFTRSFLPQASSSPDIGMEVVAVNTVKEALRKIAERPAENPGLSDR
ncbi:MAG: DNA repair protein RadA [Chloroflexi bacterium]|nr:DNA repair protein RadA [Chloroflexota bacterium]